jgi:lipoprotein-anchoring transpeptidase ErfK/SrfK
MPKKFKGQFSIHPFYLIFSVLMISGSLILSKSILIYKDKINEERELEPVLTDGTFKTGETTAYFLNQKINSPLKPLNENIGVQNVLSAENQDDKWIEVDLTNQKLRAWEGNKLVYEFPVSTGKKQWGTDTPPGVYRIWYKTRYTLMQGGSGSTYYYLPNVPCTQFFYKGFGLHGTYWHNNFGHPMSHGCVNMKTEDACTIFPWTSPPIEGNQTTARPTAEVLGTRVVVHGDTPLE